VVEFRGKGVETTTEDVGWLQR